MISIYFSKIFFYHLREQPCHQMIWPIPGKDIWTPLTKNSRPIMPSTSILHPSILSSFSCGIFTNIYPWHWHPPATIFTNQARLDSLFSVTCIPFHCPIVFGCMVGMWGTMIVTKEAPKSPRSPQSFTPKPKPRRAIGGEGALRGFPALNLSLQPDAKVKFQPTRSVSGPWGSSQPNPNGQLWAQPISTA